MSAALNDVLHDCFDGVPSNAQVAAALDLIVEGGALDVRQAIVLDAVARALIGTTADGWKFGPITGPKKQHRRTKQEAIERRGVAERYERNKAAGGVEFARAKALEDGDRSAKEAHLESRPAERMKRFLAARIPHEKRIEELSHKMAKD